MKGRKRGHSLSSPFILLFFCIAGHATDELDGSEEEHVVGAALPPLKLVHSFCAMKADDGPCKAIHIRYFFNIKSRKCEVFEYGGCHGNENNFLTLEECQEKCVVTELSQKMPLAKIKKALFLGKPDFCLHPQEPGVCRGYFTRYFYNKETKLCEAFKYGGCLGNQNNFRSLEECQNTCQDNSNLLPTVTAEEHSNTLNSSSPAEEHPNTLNSSSSAEEHSNTLNSSSPAEEHPNTLNISSPAEDPSQSPGIFGNLLPTAPNEKSNTLNSSSPKEEPNQFPYFFEPPPIPSLCMTPMDRGLCRAKELRFFYNYSTGRCRPFSYSGCGGNENNFISRKSCLRICKKGFNKKKGEKKLIKIKKKRKKQPVKALGMEIIPERMQL
ncbi:tissue factor pathway inhibitor-like isoform X4 [Cyanistes caeruleus]|nr:tissue factor pathway inhibitor-like isoform X4 [Cyanistes caeruleus]XP_023786460.1 tissue factor pathway inhibitor-like isoform X4 [Cyanistes caeruleus]XP_023786461.1 tissue factor pathway inhibitor-like isoform X4 [Cyanistes caeruleus]